MLGAGQRGIDKPNIQRPFYTPYWGYLVSPALREEIHCLQPYHLRG